MPSPTSKLGCCIICFLSYTHRAQGFVRDKLQRLIPLLDLMRLVQWFCFDGFRVSRFHLGCLFFEKLGCFDGSISCVRILWVWNWVFFFFWDKETEFVGKSVFFPVQICFIPVWDFKYIFGFQFFETTLVDWYLNFFHI